MHNDFIHGIIKMSKNNNIIDDYDDELCTEMNS